MTKEQTFHRVKSSFRNNDRMVQWRHTALTAALWAYNDCTQTVSYYVDQLLQWLNTV